MIAGETHYMQQVGFGVRAEIRMAQGDDRGAGKDVVVSLQKARAILDPQALDPALMLAARAAYRNGDPTAAHALMDELSAPERAGSFLVRAALVCHDLSRELLLPARAHGVSVTPWAGCIDGNSRGRARPSR